MSWSVASRVGVNAPHAARAANAGMAWSRRVPLNAVAVIDAAESWICGVPEVRSRKTQLPGRYLAAARGPARVEACIRVRNNLICARVRRLRGYDRLLSDKRTLRALSPQSSARFGKGRDASKCLSGKLPSEWRVEANARSSGCRRRTSFGRPLRG